MKTIRIISLVAIAAMTLSCSKEIADIEKSDKGNVPGQDEKAPGVPTYFTATSSDTKTYIDNPDEPSGPYSVKWTTTDSVCVNGKGSLKGSTTVSADGKTVNFVVTDVNSPYLAISPMTACKGPGVAFDSLTTSQIMYVNGTGSPQYHEYTTPTTYSPKTAIMAAYSEAPESLEFKHLMTYLKITVNPGTDTDNILNVYIRKNNTEDPNIAGTWKITYSASTGEFTFEPHNLTSVIQWSGKRTGHTTGLEQGNPFYVAIPAVDYPDGLIVTVKDYKGHFQSYVIKPADAQFASKRGTIITKTLTFSPVSGTINSAEDWNAFAAAVNSGKDADLYRWVGNGTVKIGQDFSGELTKIQNLKYNIDGHGYTITRENPTGPLFRGIGAQVKDLTLAGTMDITTTAAASFADSLRATGSMVNCVNNMNITTTVTSDNVIMGGLVRIIKGGSMTDCTNNGNLTANIDFSAQTCNLQVGGIAAQTNDFATDATITIKNCDNNGALTINPTCSEYKTYALNYNSVGGIVAWCRHSDATLVIDGCDNNGAIEYTGTGLNDCASAAYCCVGGIIGTGVNCDATTLKQSGNTMKTTIKNCTNKGNIHNCYSNFSTTSASSNKVFTGGIAGSLFGNTTYKAEIINCNSEGTIIPYDLTGSSSSSRPGYCQVTGGVIGFGGYVKIDSVKVNCSIGNGKRPSVAYGSVIGFTIKTFELKNSTVWTKGYWTRFGGYQQNRATAFVVPCKYGTKTAMGYVPSVTGSIVSDCTIGIEMHTSTDTMGSDNKSDQSGNLTSTLHWTGDANCVCGHGYTTLTDDVTFENVTYVTKNPFN